MMQSSNNPNNNEAQQQAQLTSTTAPGKIFANRSALAQHYKSQWHTYNLKRREAGLPPLLEHEFEARLQAAQEALQAQQAPSHQTAHLKNKTNKKHKDKKQQQSKNKKQNSGGDGVSTVSQSPAYDRIKQQQQQQEETEQPAVEPGESTKKEEESEPQQSTTFNEENTASVSMTMEQQVQSARETLDIDPRRCLFDRHVSANVQANVHRMQQKYGFFVPDAEYLVDLDGLIGYCHEKIHVGRVCLYCQKTFGSGQACVTHMRSTRHTKLRYEAGIDLEEFDVFYDFGDANREFLMSGQQQQKGEPGEDEELAMEKADGKVNGDMDEDDDEWEDMSDEGEMELQNDDNDDDEEEDDDNDDIYAGYEQEVAAMGLDVTPLGELVFPDGRIVGHRAFRRYYKQRAPRQPDDRASVQAARLAAGDRLYQGRVVNIYNNSETTTLTTSANTDHATAAAARQAGLKPSQLHGAVGKGVLVASRGDAATNNPAYTQVSIYRYRAALRKQRRGEAKGQQLHQRTNMNVNRMDKKHNRLMNGVSVAHAAR